MLYIFLIIAFTLLQALLIGHIHILGVATPLLYVYFVLLFPHNFSKWAQLLLCFAMGLSIDMFSNTPGLAAASMTLLGFVQPYTLELFLKKEDEPDLRPGIATMGFTRFLVYSIMLVVLYCLVFFSLEAFAVINATEWLLTTFGSMLLTLITIIIIDSVRR
ncbi:MAG: rod shape-determining protein MreD [Prevotella sp.]|jgi:rod shape-determining protein MreD|nr:rod shape-determining protein MreD [Prevotella sp.]